jgi:small subunit ribosomal protein S8
MYTDPIADMLTRIRNACAARKTELVLPYSKFKSNLAALLLKEGFVSGVNELTGHHKMLQINLKYGTDGQPVIGGIKRVSKPGQRIYLPVDKIPRTNSGFGVTVISTPKGLLSDRRAKTEWAGK